MKFETGNWKKYKDIDALPNFKFQISSFDIDIQFDNKRFFEKSVNQWIKDAKYFTNGVDKKNADRLYERPSN
ncbi:MAG: hypothetical protein C4B58_02345 [Deltaproteobacteria bacterium]|nr:MAG: hypothetical protein C4B58_02345 [Deltaproteobacteria bacterium]